jgi:hypothetical protein
MRPPLRDLFAAWTLLEVVGATAGLLGIVVAIASTGQRAAESTPVSFKLFIYFLW